MKGTEKAKFEKLLEMSSGYVLNFSDSSLEIFFSEFDLDIHDAKYRIYGSSKANKMRGFWEIEHDNIVGQVLNALLEKSADDKSKQFGTEVEQPAFDQCKAIAQRLLFGGPSLDPLRQVAEVFNASHLAEQIRRMEAAIHADPGLAIGTAKELIETCCKTILAERGKPVIGSPDVSTLTKDTLKELKLVPDGVSESARGSDVVKRILRSLGTIGNDLAELRGLYGTGHGKHGTATGLSSRHARLAVGAAATFATFLFNTHTEQNN